MIPSGISGVVPIAEMRGDDEQETALLHAAYREARAFLLSRKWCFGIREIYFGAGLGGVVSVFLAQLDPIPTDVDEWLWVIVGDVPPAYLVLDVCRTPIDALKSYIDLLQEWVDLAREGTESPDVIPVNRAPTRENAEELQLRLDSLRTTIIPWLEQGPAVQ